ncbi:HAT family dimerization domain-containing protein [Trifolium pratense]|uniref:HAT family dimerization domain-containing protein n=1 Tax=Trifolium pratense TaxID=57577 RepID=A0A2K3KJF0_TRIPR|nr:HAT family dimerization domain-containing protein [Trifolium pratense]
MDSQTVEGAAADLEPVNVEGDDETPESKRAKTTTADCWKYFTKVDPGPDGVPKAKCKGCAKVFRAGGKNHGTTTLNRHWPKCDKIKSADIGQVMIDMQGKLKNLAIDKKELA